MAELVSRNRLQPALLDRLTDLQPDTALESRERRVISLRQLRDGVLRDIGHLLNARSLYAVDLEAYPAIADSVLNAGLPDYAGKVASNVDKLGLARDIAETLRRFEPRILADTLKVSPVAPERDAGRNTMAFLVEGDLWAQPYPERLYLMTELDLETGRMRVGTSSSQGRQ
ncbi:type VI secretion system baseplate subunit TssE [Bordetella genomosp. 11]|uniref:Type VI secretion system lysozyme n=1 Tax=Bordetella genomosp. 11 TaxID=1416808 RepID=A0A261ULI4_9BORD|nr:type VI secretion system baseplate subunit TssE [Bordetella genomosp. 11]OZI62232.1 type VI secretion system lysozyme [Bordetella genomosp. 11]